MTWAGKRGAGAGSTGNNIILFAMMYKEIFLETPGKGTGLLLLSRIIYNKRDKEAIRMANGYAKDPKPHCVVAPDGTILLFRFADVADSETIRRT